MSKRMKAVFIAVVLVATFVTVFQSITIHNMKKEQEEQFYEHICMAAQEYETYKERGNTTAYESAARALQAASGIAELMDKNGDYQSIHSILNTLLVYYGVCPELDYAPDYWKTQMDDIISALNDYTTNRNPAELYTKLKNVRIEILKIQQENAERHGLCF